MKYEELLFSSLQERNIPNPLFRANINNYGFCEIKVKRDDTLRQPTESETGITPRYSLSPFDLAHARKSRNKNITTLSFSDDQVTVAYL